jgi:hypothetical protein
MAFAFANNVSDTLVSAITVDSDALVVTDGERFPEPGYGEVLALVVRDPDTGLREIMYCDTVIGDTLYVTRGDEGTTPRSFPAGSQVSMPITAGILEYLRDL